MSRHRETVRVPNYCVTAAPDVLVASPWEISRWRATPPAASEPSIQELTGPWAISRPRRFGRPPLNSKAPPLRRYYPAFSVLRLHHLPERLARVEQPVGFLQLLHDLLRTVMNSLLD
jgi:hypothetical protein